MNKKPVIFDMDSDPDNLLALGYALQSPDLHVLGVCTVHGFYSAQFAAAQAAKFLQSAGHSVPVIAGADTPLMRPRMAKALQDPTVCEASADAIPAWDWMYEQITASQEPVTLCLLGPATNLAMLLHKYPEVAPRIAQVLFAGGCYSFGTITASACHKVYFDAEAMQYVMHAGVPFTMVSVDVTSGYEQGIELASLLNRWSGSLWHGAKEACAFCTRANKVLRTPMAIVTLTHPELFAHDNYKCEVELHGTYTYGMTVVYLNNFDGIKVFEDGTKDRMEVQEKDKNIRYVHAFDTSLVMELIENRISALEEVPR